MDFKAAREKLGLTLEELSELAGYSVSTLNGLELNGEGSKRLRAKVMQVLRMGDPEREERILQLGERAPTIAEDAMVWRERALRAEGTVEDVRKGLLSLVERIGTRYPPAKREKPNKVSSTVPSAVVAAGEKGGEMARPKPPKA